MPFAVWCLITIHAGRLRWIPLTPKSPEGGKVDRFRSTRIDRRELCSIVANFGFGERGGERVIGNAACARSALGVGGDGVVLGHVLPAAGSRRFRGPPDTCEPALGPENAPEHCVSVESNEGNFLSLGRHNDLKSGSGGRPRAYSTTLAGHGSAFDVPHRRLMYSIENRSSKAWSQ